MYRTGAHLIIDVLIMDGMVAIQRVRQFHTKSFVMAISNTNLWLNQPAKEIFSRFFGVFHHIQLWFAFLNS